MLIAALFTIAEIWGHHGCLSMDEWIKKRWYIYTMEYCSAIKNEILPSAITWMDLEGIVLSQTEKDKCHMWNLENKINKQQKQAHRHREHFDGCRLGGKG